MKLKVAGGLPGNFSRVCPILNRATAIYTRYVLKRLANSGIVLLCPKCVFPGYCASTEKPAFFGFFMGTHETHGGVLKSREVLDAIRLPYPEAALALRLPPPKKIMHQGGVLKNGSQ